nr:hypothetical protein [Streptomyces sp. Alain-F2R5]
MPTSTARSTQFLLERFSPKQVRSIAAANRRINLWEGAVSSGKTIASAWAWMMFVPQASTRGELIMIGKDAVGRQHLPSLPDGRLHGRSPQSRRPRDQVDGTGHPAPASNGTTSRSRW